MKTKNWSVLFGITLVGLVLTLFCGCVQDDWLNGWNQRKVVSIHENSSTNLTNYAVKVSVDFKPEMRSDFSDIRFTDADGKTLLPYWIESYIPNASAVVWIKVPAIPAGKTKSAYMYYKSSTTTSASNGSAVFDFFDDFLGSSLDTDKWNTVTSGGGTYAVNKGLLDLFCLGEPRFVKLTEKAAQSSQYYRVRSKLSVDVLDSTIGYDNSLRIGHDLKYRWNLKGSNNAKHHEGLEEAVTWEDEYGRNISLNQWYIFDIYWDGAYLRSEVDDTEYTWARQTTPMGLNAEIWCAAGNPAGSGVSGHVDWILVRGYANPEPTAVVED
jgi:hypothetical protein